MGVAQHGAVRGQTTATRARGPGTQYFTFGDEDVPGPQVKELQRVVVYVDAPSLDVPALHIIEEVDADVLARLAFPDQMIVQELPEVPCSSSVSHASQATDIEQVLDVPVLHTVDDDFGIPSDAHLKHLMAQFRVRQWHSLQRWTADEVVDVPGQVVEDDPTIFDEFVTIPAPVVEEPDEVPLVSVSGSSVEQVVDVPVPQRAHVPRFAVSDEFMEQVADVPGLRAGARARSAAGSPTSWAAAASLEAPQEHIQGVCRTFHWGKKCEGCAAVECATGCALQPVNMACLWG